MDPCPATTESMLQATRATSAFAAWMAWRAFARDKDRHVFLKYLRDALGKGGCSLNAFVLMTNHVHMLVTPSEPGAMPAMMHSVGRGTRATSIRSHGRTGPLFGGRYWASLIEIGKLLSSSTMRYVELNPVRAGMVDHPGRYPWSSYLHNTAGNGARNSPSTASF